MGKPISEASTGSPVDEPRQEDDVEHLASVYGSTLSELRENFQQGVLRTKEQRLQVLEQIRKMIVERADDFQEAIRKDMNRSKFGKIIEMAAMAGSVDDTIADLGKWMQPRAAKTPIQMQPASSMVVPEPKGVILIISPWNFPMLLALQPLIEAIAAGNVCILKPSEVSVHSSAILARVLPEYVDSKFVRVIEGAVKETTALLKLRYDHIVYTGNTFVGRIVARAAAEHLTPVTLELGGKNPCYVDKNLASIEYTAKNITSGSLFSNCGQVCMATDYLLVHKDIKEELLKCLAASVVDFYGEDAKESGDIGRIVNEKHFDRIAGLLSGHGGKVLCGGLNTADRNTLYIPPTYIVDPSLDSKLMKEEIFGPVCAIITVDDMEDAIEFINKREKALCIKCMTEDQKVKDEIMTRTSSGNLAFNDYGSSVGNFCLPFGGVGESGMGQYHGQYGFEEFSNLKAIMSKSTGWVGRKMADIEHAPHTETFLNRLSSMVIPKARKSGWFW